MRVALALFTALVAAALAPTPVLAVTTIGSDLAGAPEGSDGCASSSCTRLQTALPGRPVSVPSDGVVVRWRVRGSAGALQLQVLRPVGDGSYTAISSSSRPLVSTSDIQSFDARVAVKAGDVLAIRIGSSSTLGWRTNNGAADADWEPAISTGETRQPSSTTTTLEDLYNADVEPDADGDGYGDESQDGCPGDPTSHITCADVALTFASTPSPAFFGQIVTTNFTVSNKGPGAAQGVYVTGLYAPPPATGSTLPESELAARPPVCSGAPTLNCNLQTIPAGQSVTVSPTLIFWQPDRLGQQMRIVTGTRDPNTADNQLNWQLDVRPRPGACTNIRSANNSDQVRFEGTAGGDRLLGLGGVDHIYGLEGADCISGGRGNDTITGGPGKDKLDGGPGADVIKGQDGNDVLIGGPGKNRLVGGPGNDTIKATNRARDLVSCGPGSRDHAVVDKLDRVSGCESKVVK